MLDSDTKRRIDAARDLLVGKVPDPKSQVEQITIALIYKFMDDIDAQSQEWGGNRSFFAGDFARYRWTKLLRGGLGGRQMLDLYTESLAKMPENPGLPPLFRNIFNNAYLPYRDPETLRAFLKIIDEFQYDHSERLGDAFEYLLAVLGAQGDAGQFRTPRHIIDFIVNLLNPQKQETILDPSCGTAGFLIASYKHILKTNVDNKGNSTLTPDDKGALAVNFKGYDISPDMVRLSLVNMYLHGFVAPQIYEYDTLTSEQRWRERADVILANPPFMSPKGGIRPHSRFSIRSKRSEVLFVDYIAEHLTANGRAGIIVPEGIIFQSQSAYQQLRKLLVEKHLAAVISLPAGVFQPYSGVKTSILILDNALARQRESIAFFKVKSDGYDLGAQRRPIEQNDLPQVAQAIKEWQGINTDELEKEPSSSSFILPKLLRQGMALIVKKSVIAASKDYNLSQERYKQTIRAQSQYPMVKLGEVCVLVRGVTYSKRDEVSKDGRPVLRANNIAKDTSSLDLSEIKRVAESVQFSEEKKLQANDIFICMASGSKEHIGKVAFVASDTGYYFGGFMGAVRVKPKQIEPAYLFEQLRHNRFNQFLREQIAGANINNLNAKIFYRFEIPLPPLEIQKEIIHEIENYQKVLNAAQIIIQNYHPTLPLNPNWPLIELGRVCILVRGVTYSKGDEVSKDGRPVLRANNIAKDTSSLDLSEIKRVSESVQFSEEKKLQANDIFICMASGSKEHIGKVAFVASDTGYYFGGFMGAVRVKPKQIEPAYLFEQLRHNRFNQFLREQIAGANINNLNAKIFYRFEIPLPPLEIQKEIIHEIENYQKVLNAAQIIIQNYHPTLPLNPNWPLVQLGEVISLEYGKSLKADNRIKGPYPVFGSNGIVGYHNSCLTGAPAIIVGRKGSAGAVNFSELPCYPIDTTFFVKIKEEQRLDIRFCYYQLLTLELDKVNVQSGVPGLNRNDAYRKMMALPSLSIQRKIVAEIEAERELVDGNRQLIERFEKKIRDAVGRVWGEE